MLTTVALRMQEPGEQVEVPHGVFIGMHVGQQS